MSEPERDPARFRPGRTRLMAEAAVGGLARLHGISEMRYEHDSGDEGEQRVTVILDDGSRHTLTINPAE